MGVVRASASSLALPPGTVQVVEIAVPGSLVPEGRLIEQVARALDLPAVNLAVIAGLDPADPGRA